MTQLFRITAFIISIVISSCSKVVGRAFIQAGYGTAGVILYIDVVLIGTSYRSVMDAVAYNFLLLISIPGQR